MRSATLQRRPVRSFAKMTALLACSVFPSGAMPLETRSSVFRLHVHLSASCLRRERFRSRSASATCATCSRAGISHPHVYGGFGPSKALRGGDSLPSHENMIDFFDENGYADVDDKGIEGSHKNDSSLPDIHTQADSLIGGFAEELVKIRRQIEKEAEGEMREWRGKLLGRRRLQRKAKSRQRALEGEAGCNESSEALATSMVGHGGVYASTNADNEDVLDQPSRESAERGFIGTFDSVGADERENSEEERDYVHKTIAGNNFKESEYSEAQSSKRADICTCKSLSDYQGGDYIDEEYTYGNGAVAHETQIRASRSSESDTANDKAEIEWSVAEEETESSVAEEEPELFLSEEVMVLGEGAEAYGIEEEANAPVEGTGTEVLNVDNTEVKPDERDLGQLLDEKSDESELAMAIVTARSSPNKAKKRKKSSVRRKKGEKVLNGGSDFDPTPLFSGSKVQKEKNWTASAMRRISFYILFVALLACVKLVLNALTHFPLLA